MSLPYEIAHFTQTIEAIMNIPDFARRLAELCPSGMALAACGLSSVRIDEITKRFQVKIRNANPVAGNDFDELQCCDLGCVVIGMIRFSNRVERIDGDMRVGFFEADYLMIDHSTLEVFVQEFGSNNHRLWCVAKDFPRLLDALIIAAIFFAELAVGRIAYDNLNAAADAASQCAESAGGQKYTNFYRTLLGAEL